MSVFSRWSSAKPTGMSGGSVRVALSPSLNSFKTVLFFEDLVICDENACASRGVVA